MPWSEKQVKTFKALASGWKPYSKHLEHLASLGQAKLSEMASEGVKKGKKRP